MHIAEGVLSVPVLVTGAAVTLAGLTVGMKRVGPEKIPKVALLTAAFFVASLVHVPIGPSNAHLVLNGLLGIILGLEAFPAIFIALLLQAVLFQFGGLTTLGVNTANMAVPGAAFGILAKRFISLKRPLFSAIVAGACSSLSVLGAGFLVALSLWFSGDSFSIISKIIFTAHLPIAFVEAVLTGMVVRFLLRVRPEILGCNVNFETPRLYEKTNMICLFLMIFFILLPADSHAHRVNLFAWFNGEKVVGKAYYSNGRPAEHAKIEIIGTRIGSRISCTTDEKGRFSFRPPGMDIYRLILHAGQGHRATTLVHVKINKLTKNQDNLPSMKGKDLPKSPGNHGFSSVEALGKNGSSSKDVAKVVDKVLKVRLQPLYRAIEDIAISQSRIKIKDVVSGLGYIIGIMGIWAYMSSKRKP